MSRSEKKRTKSAKSFLAWSRAKKPIRLVLKIAGSVIAIILLFRQVDLNTAINVIINLSPILLLAAFIVFNISQWISALRLNCFFRDIHVVLSELFNIRLYYIGMFYNLLIPGGISGDGFKAYLIHKNQQAGLRSLASAMIADRLTGLIAIGLFAAALLSIIDIPVSLSGYTWIFFPLLAVGIGLYLLLFPAFRSDFPKTLLLACMVQLAQLFAIMLILINTLSPVQAIPYLLIFLVSSVATIIPITVGGLGLRELVFLYGAREFGLQEDIAVGASLTFFLITLVSSLPGIFLHNTLDQKNLEVRQGVN